MRALMEILHHPLTVNNRTLKFSKMQLPSRSRRRAAGTETPTPFIQPWSVPPKD